MATFADREVVAAKRTLAVMARQATLRSTGGVMVERLWRGHLSSLRQAASDLVAFGARYFLMLEVIKADAECRGHFRCPGITTQLMTRSARRDIPAARLSARSVAPVTSCVRGESRGY